MRVPRPLLGLVALLGVALAGCADGEAVGRPAGQPADTGFVAGGGVVTVVPEAERAAAPPFAGPLLGGGSFDLAEQQGQVVVLNVWGSWCAPCRAEAPALQGAWEQTQDDGVLFVGVNTHDTEEGAQAFVDEFGLTYDSVLDPTGRLLLGFRDTLPAAAIPSTLVVDRDGRVAARVLGEVSERTLVDLVEEVA
jgi:peroxiredoxin